VVFASAKGSHHMPQGMGCRGLILWLPRASACANRRRCSSKGFSTFSI